MAFLPILYQTTARNGVAMAVRPDASTKSAAGKPLEEDLEQYGVWVKAEPRDIVEETETVSSPSSASSDGLGDLDLPKEEDFLSEDEEKFLGSFEEIEVEEEKEEMAEGKDEAGMMPDIDNLPPLEDFEIKEETMNDIEDLGASTIDISLDDLEKEAETPSPIRPDAEIDISTIKGLSFDEDAEEMPAASSGPVIEDVSAEFLDFIEEPSEAPSGDAPAAMDGFAAAEAAEAPEDKAEPEFEPIDMDLHFDDTIPSGTGKSGSASGAEPGFEEVSEFDDFLKEAPDQPGFDDLSAVEKELSAEAPEIEEAPPAARKAPAAAEQPREQETGKASLSNELLLKIAEELSSIRGELVTLKGQISSFKKEEGFIPPAAATEETTSEASPAAPARSMGGFFDDEEDETIALTGDELDNILNTADFTEEPAEEEGESLELPSLENILPESGDYSAPQAEEGFGEEAAIEEIRLEPAGDSAIPAFEEEKEERIEAVAAEGVNHLTQAPEDTSYLEEPLPDEEPLDLSEPGLVQESFAENEPLDLGLEEETESPLDIAEELPVVEGRPEAEAFDDLTLGAKASEGYLPSGVDEALPVEAVPEFEESGFGEISLTVEDEAEIEEELEEIKLAEEANADLIEESLPGFEEEIEEKTVKPAEPVALHPDELPTSLDDSFFLSPVEEGEEEVQAAAAEPAPEAPPMPRPAAVQTPEEPKTSAAPAAPSAGSRENKDDRLRGEIKSVLSYLDKLLESLPEDKIEEFARSEYFDTYKKLFEELGLV
jgi:hypothetical protein